MVTKSRKILILGNGYDRPFTQHGSITLHSYLDFPHGLGYVDDFDLVVFTGGHDVSPTLYRESPHRFTQSDWDRDIFECQIFTRCRDKGIKMVGICRGSQFLTVMNGGLLIQHVNNHAVYGAHAVVISETKEKIQVTSTHHQMMVPRGNYDLLAYALGRSDVYEIGSEREIYVGHMFMTTHDGTFKEPEVVWYPDTNCLAVQYHPEYMGQETEGYQYFQELLNRYVL